MPTMTGVRRRVAVLAAVAALAVSAAGCLADANAPGVPPGDPAKVPTFTSLNARRRAARLPELKYSPKLEFYANTWSNQMAASNSLSHQNLLGLILFDGNFANYWALGENVLRGPRSMSGEQIVTSWMNSGPHRANILNPSFTVVGLGVTYDAAGRAWICAMFGGV
jgi:uncharacterized protein YkwD